MPHPSICHTSKMVSASLSCSAPPYYSDKPCLILSVFCFRCTAVLENWNVICKCTVNIQETMVRLWLLFPLIRHSWLNVRQKSNLRPKPTGGIYSDRNRDPKYNCSSCAQAPPDLSIPSIWQCYCCITHLIAVNLVAIFQAKCFAKGNVDGIAHNGHCKRITYYLREQWDVWGTRGFQAGSGKCEWFFTSELIVDGSNFFQYTL